MRTPHAISLATLLLLAAGCGSSRFADSDLAAEALRTAYFQMDYIGGAALARAEARFYRNDLRVQGWSLFLRSSDGEARAAIAEARALTERYREDPFAWLAAALVWSTDSDMSEEALEASAKAYQMMPEDPDIVWGRANTLREAREYVAALAVIDEHIIDAPNEADLHVLRGQIHYSLAFDSTRDRTTEMEASQAAFQAALRCDGSRVRAHYNAATGLLGERKADEAMVIMEQALEAAPNVLNLHRQYWRAVTGSPSLAPEEKKERVLADLERVLTDSARHASILSAVAYAYESLGMQDEESKMEERILKEFPSSSEAEWVEVNRYRTFSNEAEGPAKMSEEQRSEYRGMLQRFLSRRSLINESLRGDAYRNLFYVVKEDESASDREILEAVRGMVEWEDLNPHVTYAQGATVLAERTDYYDEAERIARQGIEEGRRKVESQRSFYGTEADYNNSLDYMESIMRDALGWVYFQAGRLEDSERELLAGYQKNPKVMDNLHHLGQLYEATPDLDDAEKYYMKGMAVSSTGENPNVAALKALYEKRHGGMQGWEGYEASLDDIDRERRRREVLSARITSPRATPAFSLRDLAGNTVSLADLKGKVVVVNYWGIWCGWCVLEMPEFQQLHDKYADDPRVAILTINNDSNPDDVPPWMEEEDYSFNVLMDDGYVSRGAQITAFPTTWFIDAQGRIAYEKVGWSEELLEEFTWRVEDLKRNG